MFRIECFCDDKNLAKLKWALFELGAYNVSDQPVKDNKPNGKTHVPKGDLPPLFLTFVKQNKLKAVRAREMKAFVESVGYSAKSYSHVLGILKTAGIISKTGPGTSNVAWMVKRGKLTKKRAAA